MHNQEKKKKKKKKYTMSLMVYFIWIFYLFMVIYIKYLHYVCIHAILNNYSYNIVNDRLRVITVYLGRMEYASNQFAFNGLISVKFTFSS